MGSIKISGPVSVLNREVKISSKDLMAHLGGFAINLCTQSYAEAAKDVWGIVNSVEFKDNPEAVAWELVVTAYVNTSKSLLDEYHDLFETKNRVDEIFIGEMASLFDKSEIIIDNDFFVHPQKAEFLKDFSIILEKWLSFFKLPDASINAVIFKFPGRFAMELDILWFKNRGKYDCLLAVVKTPFSKATREEEAWRLYHRSLVEQINARMFDESFSLKQVFVHPNAYYIKSRERRDDEKNLEQNKIVINLTEELLGWIKTKPSDTNVKIISGGPGAGKSSFIKMFAAKLVEENICDVLYIPLHLFDPLGSIVESVARFVSQNEYLVGSPLDTKTGRDNLLVIFDGLDELSMQGKLAAEIANNFVDEILRVFAQGNKKALISGRDIIVQNNAHNFRVQRQIFNLLPFYLKEYEREAYIDELKLLEKDLRDEWWQKYFHAKGKTDNTMPEALRSEELSEITRQPLLNYLVALSYQRGKIDFSANASINEIYHDLLEAVYERKYSGAGTHKTIKDFSKDEFKRILQEIALAVWHGDGRTTTINYIQNKCKNSILEGYLRRFSTDAQKGVSSLLTAFYFRQNDYACGSEKTFEFTHKSFGEYLTASRLVSFLSTLNEEFHRNQNNVDSGWNAKSALGHWMEIFGPTAIDDYILLFIVKEISMLKINAVATLQKTLCKLIEYVAQNDFPKESMGSLSTYKQMQSYSRNAGEALFVMHYACAIRTKEIIKINWPEAVTFGTWLKYLQGQHTDRNFRLIIKCLAYIDLREVCLDMADLWGATMEGSDLSGASMYYACLGRANLKYCNFTKATLIGAFFERAELKDAKFVNASLEKTNFSSARMEGCDMRNSLLAGNNFCNAKLHNVNMTKCRDGRRHMFLRHPEVDFTNADLYDVNFSEVKLFRINFTKAELNDVNFTNAKIVHGNFTNTEGSNITLSGLEFRHVVGDTHSIFSNNIILDKKTSTEGAEE